MRDGTIECLRHYGSICHTYFSMMKNQTQYKVVDEISDEVQRWLNEPYNDIAIRFHQPRKKARLR